MIVVFLYEFDVSIVTGYENSPHEAIAKKGMKYIFLFIILQFIFIFCFITRVRSTTLL